MYTQTRVCASMGRSKQKVYGFCINRLCYPGVRQHHVKGKIAVSVEQTQKGKRLISSRGRHGRAETQRTICREKHTHKDSHSGTGIRLPSLITPWQVRASFPSAFDHLNSPSTSFWLSISVSFFFPSFPHFVCIQGRWISTRELMHVGHVTTMKVRVRLTSSLWTHLTKDSFT